MQCCAADPGSLRILDLAVPVLQRTVSRCAAPGTRKVSLKRASSRTKSSKRRATAASSRSANIPSALAELAHKNSARCARSPRYAKVAITSVMVQLWREAQKKTPAAKARDGRCTLWYPLIPAKTGTQCFLSGFPLARE